MSKQLLTFSLIWLSIWLGPFATDRIWELKTKAPESWNTGSVVAILVADVAIMLLLMWLTIDWLTAST